MYTLPFPHFFTLRAFSARCIMLDAFARTRTNGTLLNAQRKSLYLHACAPECFPHASQNDHRNDPHNATTRLPALVYKDKNSSLHTDTRISKYTLGGRAGWSHIKKHTRPGCLFSLHPNTHTFLLALHLCAFVKHNMSTCKSCMFTPFGDFLHNVSWGGRQTCMHTPKTLHAHTRENSVCACIYIKAYPLHHNKYRRDKPCNWARSVPLGPPPALLPSHRHLCPSMDTYTPPASSHTHTLFFTHNFSRPLSLSLFFSLSRSHTHSRRGERLKKEMIQRKKPPFSPIMLRGIANRILFHFYNCVL